MIQNIRRAARSTTRNISDGFGRHHRKENMQFLSISRGSQYEIEDDPITCLEDGYIDNTKLEEGMTLIKAAIKSTNGFIKYLDSKA